MIIKLISNYGFFSGILIFLKLKYSKKGIVKIPGILPPITYRVKTCDTYTFYEIFGLKSYELQLPFNPNYIIDGGANIGLSSIYFANKYPESTILAIEPEESNYYYLKINTKQYSNVKAIKNAIWTRKANLEVKDNGYGLRGFMVEEVGEKTSKSFSSISIADLVPENKIIDILKLDIEGSEKYVFENNFENWLPNVRCLIIELHDYMIKGCSKSVFNAINNYDFSLTIKGEILVFMNEKLTN